MKTADFSNQIVMITGASSGLGRQLALDFAAAGAQLVLSYASAPTETMDALIKQVRAAGGQAIACRADLGDSAALHQMVKQAIAHFGQIDILINSAGLSLDAPFLSLSEADWDRVMAVNLKGPFILSQAVGRHMVASGAGCIVNISATTAVMARAGNANYCASKAGLNMLTQSMAIELGPDVRVNAVALGFVDSPLVRDLFSAEALEEAANSVPLKRMTTYEETSQFVMMLASDAAGFVTGQTIPFDGGRVMR